MASSRCNGARTSECDWVIQGFVGELAEGPLRDAHFEGKGGFSLKKYFYRSKSSLEFLMIFLLFSVPGYF